LSTSVVYAVLAAALQSTGQLQPAAASSPVEASDACAVQSVVLSCKVLRNGSLDECKVLDGSSDSASAREKALGAAKLMKMRNRGGSPFQEGGALKVPMRIRPDGCAK
jgi:hypothetical protein